MNAARNQLATVGPSKSDELSAESARVRRDALLTALVLISVVVMPLRLSIWARNSIGVILLVLGISVAIVRWKKADLPVAVMCGWLLLVGLGVSVAAAVSPRFALEAALVPLAGIGLFVSFGSGLFSRIGVMCGLLIAGLVVAVLTIVNFVSASLLWMELLAAVDPEASLLSRLPVAPPRVGAVPGLHANQTAPVLYLALTTGLALSRVSDLRRIVWFSSGVIAAALLATGSRAGLIAAFAGVVAVLYLNRREGIVVSQRSRRLRLIAGLGLSAGLVGIWATGFRPSFIFRSTFSDRLPVIGVGLDMFESSPALGNGPGAFGPLFPVYGPDLYPGARSRLVWNSAHNGYVQSLLEHGLIGTGLIVAAIALVVWAALRGARRLGGAVRVSTVALAGGLLAFGIHSLVDVLHIYLAPLAFLAAVAGAALIDLPSRLRAPSPVAIAAIFMPIAVVPILVAATVSAHLDYLDGVEAVASNDFVGAIQEFEAASEADPLPVYLQALNFAQLQSGLGVAQPGDTTLGAFEPPSIALNLASSSTSSDQATALSYAQSAFPRIQGDEVAMVQYGFIQLELEDRDSAVDVFTGAVSINPWLAGSPFLDMLPDEVAREVLDSTYNSDPCLVGEQWILTGVATDSQVRELSETCAAGSPAQLHADLGLGNPAGVRDAAMAALSTTPDNFVMRRLAGMAELELGMTTEGRRHLATGARLGDPYSALALHESYPVDSAPAEVEALAEFYEFGYSPVLLDDESEAVYLYGSVTMGTYGHRVGLPSPLVDGDWRKAHTAFP